MDSGTTDAQWQSSAPAQGQEDRLDNTDMGGNAAASHADYEAAEEDVGEGEGNDERAGLLSGQNGTFTVPDHVAKVVDQESGRFRVLRKRNTYLIAASVTLAIALLTLIVCYIVVGRRKSTPPPWTLPKKLYNNGTHDFRETVIVISLDGFRNDYLDRASQGIRAEYMNPSFPSVTFPNHWTLATGLYPESHGIVGNEFYDPELHESFFYKDPKLSWDSKWWYGEPIWITTVLQNVSSAVLMWPGCSTTIHNTTPTYHVDYSNDLSLDNKVDQALNWLDIENVEERPQLIALYFPDVDQMGHRKGPDSKEVNQVISQMDTMIGRLVAEIDDRGLSDWVNIVVTSDHGMSNSSLDRLIFYDEILSPDLMQYVGETEGWPLLGIRPNTSDVGIQQRMYEELALWAELHHHPHYQIYQRPDIPEKWHFSHSPRITPILAVPDLGWAFVTHSTFDIKTRKIYRPIGIHGYDNFEEEMRAIFVAKGPAFEAMVGGKGKVVQGFQNIELYEVLAGILRVHPAPNNATLHGRLLSL